LLKGLFPTLTILVLPEWVVRASLLAVVSGMLGAAYPAWLAARQDAVVALAYE
jgi:ABC-type antimicrobial peptide transport system permease subunit